MDRGPIGSISHPGTFLQLPGKPSGTQEAALKQPALPNEQYSPGGRGSIMVTACPSICRQLAQLRPTTPEPITATRWPIYEPGWENRTRTSGFVRVFLFCDKVI